LPETIKGYQTSRNTDNMACTLISQALFTKLNFSQSCSNGNMKEHQC